MTEFNLSEFIAMGGYGKYVWASWALTIVCLLGLIISAVYKRRSIYRHIQQQVQQSTAREKRIARQRADL